MDDAGHVPGLARRDDRDRVVLVAVDRGRGPEQHRVAEGQRVPHVADVRRALRAERVERFVGELASLVRGEPAERARGADVHGVVRPDGERKHRGVAGYRDGLPAAAVEHQDAGVVRHVEQASRVLLEREHLGVDVPSVTPQVATARAVEERQSRFAPRCGRDFRRQEEPGACEKARESLGECGHGVSPTPRRAAGRAGQGPARRWRDERWLHKALDNATDMTRQSSRILAAWRCRRRWALRICASDESPGRPIAGFAHICMMRV